MPKQRITIEYCKHCRTSSCFDPGFEFNRVKGQITRRKKQKGSKYILEVQNQFASELREKLLNLEKIVLLKLKEITRCNPCTRELTEAGGFATHYLPPRQKRYLEDPDSNGGLSNAIGHLED